MAASVSSPTVTEGRLNASASRACFRASGDSRRCEIGLLRETQFQVQVSVLPRLPGELTEMCTEPHYLESDRVVMLEQLLVLLVISPLVLL